MWSADSGRQSRRAARGKESLLDAACGVIAVRGLERTRFADVAQATGTAISTLQYVFGSREDILLAAVEFQLGREVEAISEIARQTPEPDARLLALIAFAQEDSEARGVSRMFWHEVTRGAVRDEELRSLAGKRFDAWRGELRAAIEQGAARGKFPKKIDADEAALEILALIDGLQSASLLAEDAFQGSTLGSISRKAVGTVLRRDLRADEPA
ncbi:MAG TPA: TetR/AcrR family transcriptional regulator [Chloroflexota bacterium]|nr:TetR/AcrR family transcriptional regulator [Chloroflexota bacterium]